MNANTSVPHRTWQQEECNRDLQSCSLLRNQSHSRPKDHMRDQRDTSMVSSLRFSSMFISRSSVLFSVVESVLLASSFSILSFSSIIACLYHSDINQLKGIKILLVGGIDLSLSGSCKNRKGAGLSFGNL